MTRRGVLLLASAGWAILVLGVGLMPMDWSTAAAISLAGLGVVIFSVFGVEVRT